MTRPFPLSLFAALALTTLAGAALAETPAPDTAAALPDLAGREIVIATENTYPPLQYLDAGGVAVGWEYDGWPRSPNA